MASETTPKNPVPVLPGIIIGLALMLGGTYVSVKVPIPALEQFAKQGVPIDLGQTIAAIGVLLFLFPVINTFFVGPLSTAINSRTTDLEKTFSEAEDLRSEMKQMKSDYEQRLAATEADAREKIQAQIKEAQQLRQTLMAESAEKADQYLKKAMEEIDQERNRLMTELRISVVDLTLKATEKVIGENLDSAKNRKLISEFIDQMEVAR